MADREPENDEVDRPSKRQKLSDNEGATTDAAMPDAPAPVAAGTASAADVDASEKSALQEQTDKEKSFGITAFVNSTIPGFSGILKQRYVDFMVHEIMPDGRVCHLEDDVGMTAKGAEKRSEADKENSKLSGELAEEASKISEEDQDVLHEIFGEEKTKFILNLNKTVILNPNRKAGQFKPVVSNPIDDKMQRQRAHEAIRNIFAGRLVTTTQDENSIKVGAVGLAKQNGDNRNNQPHRQSWDEMGGDQLHFTLYKENKDTMELINHLATSLKTTNKKFGFAGTKDRRAVTVQRVSVKRVRPEQIASVARGLFNARIGSIAYKPYSISLGDHSGNQFTITLRDCHFQGEDGMDITQRVALANDILGRSCSAFQNEGFINYFGLQRFGTYEASTDSVGKCLLRGDLGQAIDLILSYSRDALAAAQDPDSKIRISEDDKKRALGLHKWKTEKDVAAALDLIPFRFSGERNIIKHLGTVNKKNNESLQNDFQGALGTLPKNLRGMYAHAYQSFVWNAVASERLKRHGAKVIPGDLVLVSEHKDKEAKPKEEALEEVDEYGEVVINPQGENAAATSDGFERARALTEEEANSGLYSIFDVVLPQPGWDVEYPANDIGKFYSEFMLDPERGGGINPRDMRRRWRDISLPGGYRKIMAKSLGQVSFEVKTYKSDDEELVETDLSKLVKEGKSVTLEETKSKMMRSYTGPTNAQKPSGAEGDEKIATVLTFQLGSSTYATMALRELMKGGTEAFKPDFTR
ncbi:Pseudouridine synthase pus7 [Neofusicoccum parvum]|uniref:Pseudouridine synthase pus7 n=1 Tax=Neofusicoccum parvum TaxID=310453 RepID=A0ACB5S734_9PEZI|nr:Pseudouridine synthase pus7 [Neofusicoccum parvum]